MPDSQSSEPGFESPFPTVSNIGHFRSLHWHPSWLKCINEYVVIDSVGNVSDLVFARNCCIARMLPGEAPWAVRRTGYCAILKRKWNACASRRQSLKTYSITPYTEIVYGAHSLAITLPSVLQIRRKVMCAQTWFGSGEWFDRQVIIITIILVLI